MQNAAAIRTVVKVPRSFIAGAFDILRRNCFSALLNLARDPQQRLQLVRYCGIFEVALHVDNDLLVASKMIGNECSVRSQQNLGQLAQRLSAGALGGFCGP